MVKRSKVWCEICRDEDPDLFCSTRGCRRKFHVDCLRNTNQLDPDEDLQEFTCQVCQAEEIEAECYRCHKLKEGATLLVCDVCNRGAHIECVGLKEEPRGDEWVCPVCSPNQTNSKSIMASVGGGRAKLGNVDICYVCQKGGKLLCCDLCDQSFHPKCIDPEFLELTLKDEGEEQKWGCPICRGKDPLKNMGHKRMTKAERQKRSAEWQKCVKVQSRRCRANRDQFLWDCRVALKPFVSPEVMARIKKSAMAAKSAEKVEQKKEAIPKKKKPKIPVLPAPPASAPFKRTTSTSLRAAFAAEELEERRPLRRLRKDPGGSSESSERPSRSNSISEEIEVVSGRLTRQRTESEESRSETSGNRVKRRRLIESDDEDEQVKDEKRKADQDEKDKSGESRSASRRESLKSDEGMGLLKSELMRDVVDAEIDQFKLKEEKGDHEGKDCIDLSPLEPPNDESSLIERRPTATTSATTTLTTITDATPDENDNSAVSYRQDELLKEAEEKAAKKSLEILREGVLLKNYQRWGVNWLLDAFENKAGAILADEMGLGKTIQTLTFLSALKCRGMTGPHLVVVPLSTVGNWAREIRRFTPQLTFTKICGSRQEREHSMGDGVAMDGIYDIFISTYETCVTEEWFFTDRFKWQCVILDEAHRIKNEAARIRHSLDRVDCNMRILLTGTPLQNNIKELFTLLNFLFPDVISASGIIEATFQSNKKQLQHQSSTSSTKLPSSAAVDESLLDNPAEFDESKVDAITGLLSKLMLRRTKDLVVRLPKKIANDIWLPLSPSAATWYRRLLEITADADHSSIRKLLGAVIKMRICCCHPRGLVSREAQLQNFTDNLRALGWPDAVMDPVIEESKQLKETENGWKHVVVSSKLIFLDKLLRQLHHENMENCQGYKEEYLYARSNQLRKAIQERKGKLEGLMSDTKNWNNNNAGTAKNLSSVEQQKNEDAIRTIHRLKKELNVLERGEESGGGLDALEELSVDGDEGMKKDCYHDAVFGKPSTNESMFVKYLHPWNPQQDIERSRSNSIKDEGDDKKKISVNLTPNVDGGSTTTTTLPSPQLSSVECTEEDNKTTSNIRPHKVLIFTQFQLVLNELEAYCLWRGWSYMRLDGSTNKMIRELDTREFNSYDSNHFVYLISTRAGGLGINLVTANHVVLFDEDWNPFVDLQAIDRAHRIGQTRNVLVWKLMTEWTVEERMAVRRQQKLKLDKLLIQANVENLEETEGELGTSDEKLSTEEIRRLLQYGRTALMEMSFESGIENLSLEEIVNRKRRELKEVEEGKTKVEFADETPSILQSSPAISELESDVQSVVGDSSIEESTAKHRRQSISLREALNEGEDVPDEASKPSVIDLEADDEYNEALERLKTPDDENNDHVTNDNNNNEVSNESAIAAVLDEDQGRSLRPKRERKKPKLLYNPVEWKEKPKVERKLIRERYCFRCGDSGPPVQDAASSSKDRGASRDGARKNEKFDSDADPLVGCMRCPKVYHQRNCLGLDKMPPRSWMCPWHECCVCYRRSGAAGGLLIHCAECPTAFCFDCFPPEYRRYVPPPQYYENLQKRGWPVTQQKLVTFLCSRCKALKEQERRRKLTKQQLEAENKSRKNRDGSVRDEARQAQKEAKEAKQKEADEKKQFLAAKKVIDDIDRILEKDLKRAFEGLYPEKFLHIIRVRREHLVEEQKAATKAALPGKSEASEVEDNQGQQSAEEGQEKLSKIAKPKAAARKRVVIPERLKNPSDTLKLCENCLLPKHSATNCPFPCEVIKQQLDPKPETTAPLNDVSKTTSDTSNMVVDLSDNEGKATENTPSGNEPGVLSVAAKSKPVRATRPKTRTFCPKCMNASRPHSRKHCELLTDEEKEEYSRRRAKVEELIKLLTIEKGSIKPVSRLEQVYGEPGFDPMSVDDKVLDQAKRQMSSSADRTLERAMREAGLGNVLGVDSTSHLARLKAKKESLIMRSSSSSRDPIIDHKERSSSFSASPSTNFSIKKFLPGNSSITPTSPNHRLPRLHMDSTSEESESDASSSESVMVDGPRGQHQASASSEVSSSRKRKFSSLHSVTDENRPLKKSRLDEREVSSSSREPHGALSKSSSSSSSSSAPIVQTFMSHQKEHPNDRKPVRSQMNLPSSFSESSSPQHRPTSSPLPANPLTDEIMHAALRIFVTQSVQQRQQQRTSTPSAYSQASRLSSVRQIPQQSTSSHQQSSSQSLSASSQLQQTLAQTLLRTASPNQPITTSSSSSSNGRSLPPQSISSSSSSSSPSGRTPSTNSNGFQPQSYNHPYHQSSSNKSFNNPNEHSVYIDIDDSDSQSTKS